VFGSVLVDCGIEVQTWNQLQHLRENAHTLNKAASSPDGQILGKPNLPDRRSLASIPHLLLKIPVLDKSGSLPKVPLLRSWPR
jgi:hypothetical protein